MQSVSIAATLVRPVRWEVETFGFRTVSLDIRQNTTVINRVPAGNLAQAESAGIEGAAPEPGIGSLV